MHTTVCMLKTVRRRERDNVAGGTTQQQGMTSHPYSAEDFFTVVRGTANFGKWVDFDASLVILLRQSPPVSTSHLTIYIGNIRISPTI